MSDNQVSVSAATKRAVNKRRLAIGASVMTFASAIGLVSTGGWLISEAALQPPILVLQVAIVSVRAFGIMRGTFRWVERVVSHDAALVETVDRRAELWGALAKAGPRGAWRFRQGDAVTRLMQDAELLQDRLTRVVVPGVAALITAAGAMLVQTNLLPSAGLFFLAAMLIAGVLVPMLTYRIERTAADGALLERAQLNATITEYTEHRDEFRTLGLVNDVVQEVAAIDRRRVAIETRAARLSGFTQFLALMASGFGVFAGLMVAIPAVSDGRLQGPHLAVVALLPWAASEVITALTLAATARVRVLAAEERLRAVSSIDVDVPALQTSAHLEVTDLRVTWIDEPVVRGVTFSVAPGERLAIVGPSGAGKSTVVAALLGLVGYRGTIAAPHVERTESIAAVLQDTHAFRTTVRENLRLVVDAEDEQLTSVLHAVGLELDLDRDLGNAPLSGGERQRLGLARALLTHAPFIVLDEPTEHLDDDTATELLSLITHVTADKGLVMTTHRLTDLAGFDRILVLEDGRIACVGDFDTCLRENAWFRDSVQWRVDKQQVS